MNTFLKSVAIIGFVSFINLNVKAQTVLTFKHYNSSVSFYERDLDSWFNNLLNSNVALSKERTLSYEEYNDFKSTIKSAMKNNSYFTVDNLRYMTIPSSFGDSYYLKKDSDKYKSMLKSAKQVGKKDWFVNVMKIREAFLSALTDLVIENSKSIPEN